MNYEKLIDLLNDGETITMKAKITGLSRAYFYQILNRRCNITVSNLEKIASYFAVRMGYFFDESDHVELASKVISLEKDLEYANKLLVEKDKTIQAYELAFEKKEENRILLERFTKQ